jgi:hypothetical protein
MKSSNKNLIQEKDKLTLQISIEDEDSELFKRLNKIAATHKLPNNPEKPTK